MPKNAPLTNSEKLKLLAIRHRWAFEELVVDAKYTEANSLYTGGKLAIYCYLKCALAEEGKSSQWLVVKALRKQLRASGIPTLPIVHKDSQAVREEQRRILSNYTYLATEELLYEQKLQEAVVLCKSIGTMYGYLVPLYGSSVTLLHALEHCVYHSGGRRKSLCLDPKWTET